MNPVEINPQLLSECHYLGRLAATELLLSRNASLPWFILVPDTRLADVLDLAEEHRDAVLRDCAGVSEFIKQVLGFEKVNFAGLGNVVPQMHLHVIGRYVGDACWPRPVWGHLPEGAAYPLSRLQEWQAGLVKMIGLDPAPL
ncbi:MAG: HIT domain-containing protein [Halioglobus sp.]|nr:HIT domain-containing protein [Halioglobus sp.]